MKSNHKIIAFLAFALYFLTGAACLLVGSSLPHLVKLYGMPLDKVVLLGSAYAVGRVLAAYQAGKLVEQLGPIKVLTGGVLLIAAFLAGIPTVVNYYAGLCFAFLGGVGMATQDTVCPVLLSAVFKKSYASSMSAGQALFGMGGFTTPFLVGIMLSEKLPFYNACYILLLVPLLMLVCIPFAHYDAAKPAKEQGETIKPLYVKNTMLAYAAIIVICATYSATVNTLGLYITSFGENLGLASAPAAFMLTVYNIGCVTGSLVFIVILKHVKARTVLLWNHIFAFAAVGLSLLVNRTSFYFVFLFIAGVFLGVLFSVIVTVATRIGYKRISVASSLVATASGLSDIATPVVTGWILTRLGVGFSFRYVLIMIAVSILAVMVLTLNTTERMDRDGNSTDGNTK